VKLREVEKGGPAGKAKIRRLRDVKLQRGRGKGALSFSAKETQKACPEAPGRGERGSGPRTRSPLSGGEPRSTFWKGLRKKQKGKGLARRGLDCTGD